MSYFDLLIYAVFAPFRALTLIASKGRLIKLSLMPLLIGIITYSILILIMWHYFPYFADKIAGHPDGFFSQLWYYLTAGLLIIAVVLAIVFTFSLLVNIIASPFNERLAKEILTMKGVSVPNDPNFLKEIGRIIAVEAKKSLLLILIGISMFFVGFIPIFSAFSFLITASLLAFAYVDYPQEVKKWPFKARFSFYTKNILQLAVLGTIFGTVLAIPVVNLFMIPVFTGAGTLYFIKAEGKQKS